jgi:hypothetical protein
MTYILNSMCICLNGVSIVMLSVVLLRVQKQLREIRFQNTRIENQQRLLDRLTNFRWQNSISEIDLGIESPSDLEYLKEKGFIHD